MSLDHVTVRVADFAAYYPRGDLQDSDGEVAYPRAWIAERWAFLTEA